MRNSGSRTTDTISTDILEGRWKPGERLQPHRLANEYSVSTTVIREALSRIAGDGLVIVKPNRGFFIPDLNLQELQDFTELRCITEELAVKLSLERGDLEWESGLIAMHHLLSRTPRRDEKTGLINTEWLEAHRNFHAKLLEASNCQPMLHLAANLGASTELYRRWAGPTPAASGRKVEVEHREILEAAVSRDGEKTAALLRSHYETTAGIILQAGLLDTDVIYSQPCL